MNDTVARQPNLATLAATEAELRLRERVLTCTLLCVWAEGARERSVAAAPTADASRQHRAPRREATAPAPSDATPMTRLIESAYVYSSDED